MHASAGNMHVTCIRFRIGHYLSVPDPPLVHLQQLLQLTWTLSVRAESTSSVSD
jgi:hypothetical protein